MRTFISTAIGCNRSQSNAFDRKNIRVSPLKSQYWLALTLLCSLLALSASAAEKTAFDAYSWYLPYGQVVRVNCQLAKDEAAKLEGKKTQMSVALKSQDGKTILEKAFPFEILPATDVVKRVQFKQTLPEGTHTATVQIKDGAGAVLYGMNNQIVVRKYAFEHNNIGKDRIVVPPFEPVTASANSAKVWGREISFAPSGLPEKIVVLGKDILAPGGVKLILKDGAKTYELKPSEQSFFLKTPDGYDAAGSGSGSLGSLKYKLDGRLEYDGVYFVHLEVESGDQVVPVDSLTLLIPYAEGADTFSFQKNDRDTRTLGGYSRFDGIRPDAKGVIWDARKLPPRSAYGLSCDNYFVPSIYVGSGSRGLWYYADSDWDWYLNPANEHATLERVDGRLQLRILLVNDRLNWKGKRIFDFALMPQPVKPMPSGWRKVAWGYPENQYVHDTSGWRYYGDGVNAFTLPKDEDYLQLGRVMAGEAPPPEGMYGKVNVRRRDDPKPMVLYGSSLMAGTGPANGEWDTYSAEWVDPVWARKPFDPDTKSRFLNRKSYGGFQWKDDISFKPTGLQWTDSWLDFAVYYQQKLVSLARVNGTWFDNQSSFTIAGYNDDGLEMSLIENPNRWKPEGGVLPHAQNYGRKYHILQFRRYLKRLVTMCHVSGVKPFWLVNTQPTWSFGQVAWHVESDWYAAKGERDLIEHLGVPGFRAHAKTQGGLISRLQFARETGDSSDQPPREGHPEKYGVRLTDAAALELPGVERTHDGLCLLHDIGQIGGGRMMLEKMEKEFGFFDDGVEFLPYWEQKVAVADSDRIYVSVFRNPARKLAMAVLFNEKKSNRGLTVPLAIPEAKAVSDLETGEPLVDLDSKAAGFQTRCYIPPRDFRLLVWEYKP